MAFFVGIYILMTQILIGQVVQQVAFTDNVIVETVLLSDGNNYSKVTLANTQQIENIGHPALSVRYVKLLLPSKTTVHNISATSSNIENISLTYLVEPVQYPIPTTENNTMQGFVAPDPLYYKSQIPYPGILTKLVDVGHFKDNTIVTIAVYPLQYSPLDNTIEFHKTIAITLEYKIESNSVIVISPKLTTQDKSIIEKIIDNKNDIDLFVNNDSQTTYATNNSAIIVNSKYIIITSEALSPSFEEFIKWKRLKGVAIELVTIENIYSNYTGDLISGIYDNAGKIRQFLKDAYNNGNGIEYALLAGDKTFPIRYGYCRENTTDGYYIIPTDLYFSDFDGDWNVDGDNFYGEPNDNVDFYGEIYVGRIMVTNANEIINWTEKVINYENYPGKGDFSYLTKAFFTQADEMQSGNEAQYVLNKITWKTDATLFVEEGGPYTTLTPTFPKGSDVINEFNNHYGICSFMGHGGPTNVAVATKGRNTSDPNSKHKVISFENGNAGCCWIPENGNAFENMTNVDHPSIYYSMSCTTMPFDDFGTPVNERNMGEVYTCISQGGGPAYLGNTRYGWVGVSSYFFGIFVDLVASGISNIGVAEAVSKHMVYDRYIQFAHNLIGCPETELWTGIPQRIYLDVNYSNSTARVVDSNENPLNDVKVVFVDGEQRYETTTTQNGIAQCTFDIDISSQISATKSNFLPSYTYTLKKNETWTKGELIRGNIIIPAGLTLTIENNVILPKYASIVIGDNGKMVIKANCNFSTESKSKITINGNGKMIYENGAISTLDSCTILDFEKGLLNFQQIGSSSISPGTLNITQVLPPSNTIATSTTWLNKHYHLGRNVEVQAGGTLNIQNGVMKGFNDTKIVVKPGGKLILDGAKLTNSCGSQWQGIHLHGNPAMQQSTTNQPVVELKNGAIIENAVHGVYAGDPTNPGTKGGGIVYANGATFRNCGTGIYLESYRNMVQGTTTELNNLSHVTKCTFETTANYLTLSTVAPVGVYLWGVKGIYVRGNSFTNQDFAAFENTKRGTGVSVSGASCFVKFYCNDVDCMDIVKNSFNNLTIGVAIASTATLSDVTIEDNLFTNNLMAFTASGSYTGQAFFNNIHLGSQGQYGFYVFNNNNFKIEENTVVGNYAGFGVAYDGSTVANELYKNTFNKLAFGVWARNNPNLKLTCNTFTDNTQQVYSVNNGISRFQGSSQTPAGNVFLPECSNSDREIKAVSQTNTISYYYKSGDASQQPLCVTSNFRLYSTTNQNLCPTRHTGGGGPTEDLLLATKTTLEGQEAELQSLVDGGNTDKTVQAIENVQDGEEISLMSDLLDKSPFLSETALVKTATEEEVLPEIIIANVLVANPQAAKSSEVQTALDNRPFPMPDYLRDAINEGLAIVSDKEVLERNLAETTLEKEHLLSGLIHLYRNDETNDRSAETEALLLAENTLEYDYLAVENYLATERFVEAQQLFNALPSKYSLTEAQQAEYNAMEQIVSLLSVLNSNNYFLLNPEQKTQLYTLAADGQNRATMLAQGILTLVDGACFAFPEIVIEEAEGENKNQRIPTEQKPVFSFTVQPNPANDYFVVEYNLATKEFETAELRLFNNQGKQVYQQKLTKQAFQLLITTEQFEPGIYLCRLYKDNREIVETQYFASVLVIKPNQLTNPQAVVQAEQLLEGQQFFLVYPNPATVDVTVCSSRTLNCTIEVYDERGQVVNRLTKVAATNTINTRGLKPGVYHVRLVENGKVVEKVKLVVQ
jgi:hypothetical protein